MSFRRRVGRSTFLSSLLLNQASLLPSQNIKRSIGRGISSSASLLLGRGARLPVRTRSRLRRRVEQARAELVPFSPTRFAHYTAEDSEPSLYGSISVTGPPLCRRSRRRKTTLTESRRVFVPSPVSQPLKLFSAQLEGENQSNDFFARFFLEKDCRTWRIFDRRRFKFER